MICGWSEKIDRYVDAELSPADASEMEAHLRGCPACAAEALARLQLKRMTGTAGRRFTPSPEFRLKIERSIGAPQRRYWSWRWAPAVAMAVMLTLIVVSAAVWLERARGGQGMRELADLHVSTLASPNPVDVASSDRHTVKPWFQGKLPFTFNLPELQGSPFRLAGGRLAYFQQSPGAQLLFEIRKHEISIFIFQDQGEVRRAAAGSSLRDSTFTIETWTEGSLRYFAVGDAGASDIHNLRELLISAGS